MKWGPTVIPSVSEGPGGPGGSKIIPCAPLTPRSLATLGMTKLQTLHPSSFILHPSSFILHPSSFILHPSSFILHPSSFILHPSSFILHPFLPSRPLHRNPIGVQLPVQVGPFDAEGVGGAGDVAGEFLEAGQDVLTLELVA